MSLIALRKTLIGELATDDVMNFLDVEIDERFEKPLVIDVDVSRRDASNVLIFHPRIHPWIVCGKICAVSTPENSKSL